MKKQYLEPIVRVLPVDACDVIATSGECDDIEDYGKIWKIKTAG